MEEAKYLGDEIGIMSHGQLIALGTTLKLKIEVWRRIPPQTPRMKSANHHFLWAVLIDHRLTQLQRQTAASRPV